MKELTFANGDTMPLLGLGTWKAAPGEVGGGHRGGHGTRLPAPRLRRRSMATRRRSARRYACLREGTSSPGMTCGSHPSSGAIGIAPERSSSRSKARSGSRPRVPGPVPGALARGAPARRRRPGGRGRLPQPLSEVPLLETWGGMDAARARADAARGRVELLGEAPRGSPRRGHRPGGQSGGDAPLPPATRPFVLRRARHPPDRVLPAGLQDRPDTMKAAGEPVLLADPTIAAIAAGAGRDAGAGAARLGRPARHQRHSQVGRPRAGWPRTSRLGPRALRRGGDGRDRRPRPGPPLRRRHLLGAARQRLHRVAELWARARRHRSAPRARPGRAGRVAAQLSASASASRGAAAEALPPASWRRGSRRRGGRPGKTSSAAPGDREQSSPPRRRRPRPRRPSGRRRRRPRGRSSSSQTDGSATTAPSSRPPARHRVEVGPRAEHVRGTRRRPCSSRARPCGWRPRPEFAAWSSASPARKRASMTAASPLVRHGRPASEAVLGELAAAVHVHREGDVAVLRELARAGAA